MRMDGCACTVVRACRGPGFLERLRQHGAKIGGLTPIVSAEVNACAHQIGKELTLGRG